jgi:hypothetical protein
LKVYQLFGGWWPIFPNPSTGWESIPPEQQIGLANAAILSSVKVMGRDCDFWHLEWSYGFGFHMHYVIIVLK